MELCANCSLCKRGLFTIYILFKVDVLEGGLCKNEGVKWSFL